MARRYAELVGDEVRTIPVVLEGGAIAVDGAGTLVTTAAVPAAPQPQPVARPRRDRGGAPRRARRHDDRLAALRPGPRRRHRRPRRQRRRLRPPRRAADAGLRRRVRGRLAARPTSTCAAPAGRSTPSASRSRSSRSRCSRSPRSAASGSPCRTSTSTSPTASSSCRCAAIPPTTTCWRSSPSSIPTARSSASTSAPCSPTAAAASTASPSKSPGSR